MKLELRCVGVHPFGDVVGYDFNVRSAPESPTGTLRVYAMAADGPLIEEGQVCDAEVTPRVQERPESHSEADGSVGGPGGSDPGVGDPQRVGEGQEGQPSAQASEGQRELTVGEFMAENQRVTDLMRQMHAQSGFNQQSTSGGLADQEPNPHQVPEQIPPTDRNS